MVWNKTKNTKSSKDNGQFQSMWSDKRKERALKLYVEDQLSLRAVATKLKCSHGAVQQLMEAEGVIRRKTDKRYDSSSGEWQDVFPLEKYEKRIIRLYLKPMTCQEVADKIGNGCLACHVEKAAKRNGVARTMSETIQQIVIPNGRHAGKLKNDYSVESRAYAKVTGLSYAEYNYLARRLTYSILSKYKKALKSYKRKAGKFHFDHMFSIFNGYYKVTPDRKFVKRDKPMPLKFLCHPANLNLVTAAYNAYKGGTSDITFSELKERIANFEAKHGVVFD